MTAEDWAFFLACANGTTALCTAIIIAWIRHPDPDADTFDEPTPVVRFVYGAESAWVTARDYDDMLTEMDKQRIAEMVTAGAPLSRRSALEYGIGRADFERICHGLADANVAEYGGGRALALNSAAWEYLRIPPPQ